MVTLLKGFFSCGICLPDVWWLKTAIWYLPQLAKPQLKVILNTSGTHMSNLGLDSQPDIQDSAVGKQATWKVLCIRNSENKCLSAWCMAIFLKGPRYLYYDHQTGWSCNSRTCQSSPDTISHLHSMLFSAPGSVNEAILQVIGVGCTVRCVQNVRWVWPFSEPGFSIKRE